MMFRHHPQTRLARKLVDEGRIGDLMYVYAACTAAVPPDYFRRERAIGGGAMLDLGVFTLSALRAFAGEPTRVYAEEVRRSSAAADHNFTASLRFRDGVLGQFVVGQDVAGATSSRSSGPRAGWSSTRRGSAWAPTRWRSTRRARCRCWSRRRSTSRSTREDVRARRAVPHLPDPVRRDLDGAGERHRAALRPCGGRGPGARGRGAAGVERERQARRTGVSGPR
ncbi:Gfo/Idh/MocA family oxidoreductase [Streptomyces sp. M19]